MSGQINVGSSKYWVEQMSGQASIGLNHRDRSKPRERMSLCAVLESM
jgi:hypothetical protein